MDYKNTLNLPRTDFPMQASLVQREPQRLALWEKNDLYGQIRKARAGRPRFILHDGPPFANGDVHIGNALNKVLKDFVVRCRTLRGFDAPYVPGWDCHGLPIEAKVTLEFRATGKTAQDAATIRTACEAYARKYIDLQRTQFKRLGVAGDWENPYLTLEREYEAEELRLLADIVDRGFVYRGKKPVYWSIPFRTALAEAEVEYRDRVSPSIYAKFRLKGEPNTFLLIWTTTPWTLPANLAVAFHPTYHYSIVQANGDAYLVSNALLGQVAEKLKWGGYQIVRTIDADELATLEYEHPFCSRLGRLYPAEFVDNSTGTGFVHCAPGHGLDDYHLGLKVGLPIYCPVDDEGRLIHTADLPVEQQMPSSLLGKSVLEKNGRSEANEGVLALLTDHNALALREDYHHSYPHCWRSKTPIVFRAVDQWFIRIDHVQAVESKNAEPNRAASSPPFRQSVLKCLDSIQWVPDWGINRMRGAVESRPDWCISRQRTWGVPLPAFFDAQGNPLLDGEIVRKTAHLVEKHGSNVWFERSAAELWKECRPTAWTGPEATSKSGDTLDVWIDSGSSSRAVLMKRQELQHADSSNTYVSPTWCAEVYLEGSDQHRGWFQSSLLLSLAGNGAAPFKAVLTHGFIVDDDREKISKSKQGQGGYEKPQTSDRYVNEYGADVLRLWISSQDFRSDTVVSAERLKNVSETYRLLRNTLRFQLSNLFDFDPAKHAIDPAQLTALDRWILAALAQLEQDVGNAYDAYEFHLAYQKISQFASVELSAVYHDIIKDRLYTDSAASIRRRSSQTTLHRVVQRLCQMLSPILAFTADEAWEQIPGVSEGSVHLSEWHPQPFEWNESERTAWSQLFQWRESGLAELEKARQAKLIGKALDAKVHLVLDSASIGFATKWKKELQELLNVSQLSWEEGPGESPEITVSKADGSKCARCWHWEVDVGVVPEHPTICGRCVDAVGAARVTPVAI